MIRTVPIILSFLLFFAPHAHASLILQANGATTETTFSANNVSAFIADQGVLAASLYMGRNDASLAAGVNDGVAQYAISAAVEGFDTVYPYAPIVVRLNGVDNQDNPLFGQQISLMGLFLGTPFAVTTGAPQNLYWNKSRLGVVPADVFSATNVLDASGAVNANGAVTSAIVAAVGASISEVTTESQISGSYIFTAVAPHGAAFGGAGSGVAVLINAGSILTQIAPRLNDTGIKAVPLDGAQPYIQINNAATVQAAPVDIWFDPVLQRIYITFAATANGVAGSGARGIVMGYINPVTVPGAIPSVQFSFILTDFVPAAALLGAGTTRVAGIIGAGAPITISKFRSLYTSTGLTYGIIVGSSTGANAATTVSAIPLVNKSVDTTNTTWPTDPTHGTMASKNVSPGSNLQVFFSPQNIIRPYTGRGFQTPATTLADVPLQADAAVAVGGGVAPGTIQAIQTCKDTVFISTLGDGAAGSYAAGIFASQALFDGNGAIKAWTAWQRVSFSSTPNASIYGFVYQPTFGKMMSMQGLTANTIDIVATSTWDAEDIAEDNLLGGTLTNASVGFIDLINSQFSTATGGIQAAFDFPRNTDGFQQGQPNGLSAMVFTGYQKVVLAQTAAYSAGLCTPLVGDFSTSMEISTTGAVTTPGAGARIISVSGGALTTIGAVTSAAVVNNAGANGYLVVGGVGGVAALLPGWSTAAGGLRTNFSNLPASTFTLLGSYTNVRKLLNDGTNLYVLTNQTFDRIPAAQLAGGVITPTTLATASSTVGTYGSFSDVVVSGKMALLATSQGLLQAGVGANVATAANATAMAWTAVPLTESETAVTRLQPISTTNVPQAFASDGAAGGQVYVLSASTSQGLASVYRIAVADTSGGNAITSTTVQVIPDYFVQAHTSAYAALGAYRNYFRTDGALFSDSRSSYLASPLVFQAFPSALSTGVIFYPKSAKNISLTNLQGALTIGNLVRNSGLGSLIVPTGTGMQVLE